MAAHLAHDEKATHVRAHVIATLTAALGMRATRHQAAATANASPVLHKVAEESR